MKVYIGILAILGFLFYQTNKNYEGDIRFSGFRNVNVIDKKYNFHYDKPDSLMHLEIEQYLQNGLMLVETFFGDIF